MIYLGFLQLVEEYNYNNSYRVAAQLNSCIPQIKDQKPPRIKKKDEEEQTNLSFGYHHRSHEIKTDQVPSSVSETKNIKDVVVFYGFQKEKKEKRRSKLPLLCVFGLVDQPVADEHDAGLQHKEINPLIQNQSHHSSLGLITESESVSFPVHFSGGGASSELSL